MKIAVQLHPYDRESLMALAGYQRDAGNIEDALRYATRLVELEPDDPAIQQFLQEMHR